MGVVVFWSSITPIFNGIMYPEVDSKGGSFVQGACLV